jgi:hypothetical protein
MPARRASLSGRVVSGATGAAIPTTRALPSWVLGTATPVTRADRPETNASRGTAVTARSIPRFA